MIPIKNKLKKRERKSPIYKYRILYNNMTKNYIRIRYDTQVCMTSIVQIGNDGESGDAVCYIPAMTVMVVVSRRRKGE